MKNKNISVNLRSSAVRYSAVAETNNFIVLDKYKKHNEANGPSTNYQSEASLENEFIQDLCNQGYDYLPQLTTPKAMFANVRTQLQTLNNTTFTDSEWARFVEEYLDKPNDGIIDKTRKIHADYIYDFVFDVFNRR